MPEQASDQARAAVAAAFAIQTKIADMVELIHSLPPQERGEAVNELMQEFSALFDLVDAIGDPDEDGADEDAEGESEADDGEEPADDDESEEDEA